MALKDKWVNKVDGVDDVLAKDINDIAQSVISLEGDLENVDIALDTILMEQNNIIDIQENLIGGGV